MAKKYAERGRRKGRRKKGKNKHGGPKGGASGHQTMKVSLRTIALAFPKYSLPRVFFHGLWQKSRGRKPSEPLHNERNPTICFQTALKFKGEYLRQVMTSDGFRSQFRWRPERSEPGEENVTVKLVDAIMDNQPADVVRRIW